MQGQALHQQAVFHPQDVDPVTHPRFAVASIDKDIVARQQGWNLSVF
jgi:hypothetical protein